MNSLLDYFFGSLCRFVACASAEGERKRGKKYSIQADK